MRISQTQLRKIIAETININLPKLNEGDDDPYPGMMPEQEVGTKWQSNFPNHIKLSYLKDQIPTAGGNIPLATAIYAMVQEFEIAEIDPDEPLTLKDIFTELQQRRKNKKLMSALSKTAEVINNSKLIQICQFIILINQLMQKQISAASVGQYIDIVRQSFDSE